MKRIKMKAEYEIEKGLKKAQLGAIKDTAEMKRALYAPGISYLVSHAQIDNAFVGDEGKAMKRVRNRNATNR